MDTAPILDVVQALERIIEKLRPVRVHTHHRGDLNLSCGANKAVITACRPFPGGRVREILTFEVISSTEWSASRTSHFVPNLFIAISSFLSIKLRALAAYQLEMRPSPHSRSISHLEHLARYRGNCVGIQAAEGFEMLKMVC
jgi:LmbE family N-acetylglucosaminyl deacetylase